MRVIIWIVIIIGTLFLSSLVKGVEPDSKETPLEDPFNNPTIPKEGEVYTDDKLHWMHMPVICGKAETVKRYIDEHDFALVYVGVGKQGGNNEGKPVYLVSEFVTADMKQSLSVVTTLNFTESCIMYRGFDLQFKNLLPQVKATKIYINK
jgi:hypothetical protein